MRTSLAPQPRWCVERIHAAGPLRDRPFEAAFEQYLLRAPPRWTSFDPLRPLPEHRNIVVTDSGAPSARLSKISTSFASSIDRRDSTACLKSVRSSAMGPS